MSIEKSKEIYQVAFSFLYKGLAEFAPNQDELKNIEHYLPSDFLEKSLPKNLDAILEKAQKLALGDHQKNKPANNVLLSLFENIQLSDASTNDKTKSKYHYPISTLTPNNIFPTKENEQDAEIKKENLWSEFLDKLQLIPDSHKENLSLWLDHFDTALQCFTSQIPTKYLPDISLYDYYKTVTAIATSLRYNNSGDKEPLLLVQGDFFGIQDFIFAGGSETNKQSAKLLRGRSFQVSLFTELAALKVLQSCELPSTSQIMNAAGKFLIIAPNNEFIHEQLEKVQIELNRWFIENTYGLAGLGIATQPASEDDFINQNRFLSLRVKLFQQLEQTKLKRLNLTQYKDNVQQVDYSKGVCKLNSYFPAVKNNLSLLSSDQIKIGDQLSKKHRIIISDYDSQIYENNKTQSLKMNIFGFGVFFTANQESTGDFGRVTKYQQIHRFWDFSIPQELNEKIWNGYARRYINAYIPTFPEDGFADDNKYKNIDENNRSYKKDQIKTFDYIACEDRIPENEKYIGQISLMTLKGDIDNLGTIFQKGLKNNSFAKTAALSRQMNFFFSLWLPAYCAEKFPNTYTVFAGGDDFFLIGPWYSIQKLATDMQDAFHRYVAENNDIHFSIGMVMTKVGIPVPRLGELAEEALDKAKEMDGKNAVTIYQKTVKWQDWNKLFELEDEIKRLASDYQISTSYLYSLIRLAEQAENKKNNIEDTMWRSRFYYRTARYVIDKLKQEKRDLALKEITHSLGEMGIERYKLNFIIPLFNYFYQKRN